MFLIILTRNSYSRSMSSSFQPWNHDVFICFKEDTRKNFVDHLYGSLVRHGIETYKDDVTLPRGESPGPALLKAISRSRIAIVVFSENFADSGWCLNELEYINKCMDESGMIVFPVFYDVDPSEVRKQKGKYGEAFVKHECENNNKVEQWRKALMCAVNLPGWVLKDFADGYESILIKNITDSVLNRLTASGFKRIDPDAFQKDNYRRLMSSSFQQWDFDVFICARREDTRRIFVGHLYESLVRHGIQTYKDGATLPRGEPIGPAIFKAISKSRIAIVVFSENFAHSRWCLDELEYIIKCMDESGLILLPVFYDVDPSDVRKQKGKYGYAFDNFESENSNKVEVWREALVRAGSIAGWESKHIANGMKSILIKDITDTVLNKLPLSSGFKRIDPNALQRDNRSMASSFRPWDFDVFVSFRGEDTGKNFVGHLYESLVRHGIPTYKDDVTLPRGELIGAAIFKAISKSRIAIVVFSENFADASWCLDELEYIMKCKDESGLIVFPVFYDVDPSEVRKQKGKYGKAFDKHKYKNNDKVEVWREALVRAGSIAGWEPRDFSNSDSELIKGITDTVLDRLRLLVFDVREDLDLEGINTRLQDLRSKLEIGSGGVRMIGIWGVKGCGKTTLADLIYNEFFRKFDCSCFLENISEKSSKDGLISLQEKILSDVWRRKQVKVHSIEEGKYMIKGRLCYEKVLIVLDGVDHIDQLMALAGSHDWFGEGSRIIITTRDLHLLNAQRVDMIHKISSLDDDEAIEPFHKPAFHDDNIPTKDYELQYSYLENSRVLRINGSLQKILWNNKYLLHLRCLILSDMHGIVTTPDFGELPCLQVLELHYCSSLEEIHPSLGHQTGLTYLSVIGCHKLRTIPTITGMKKLKTLRILDCDALHEFPENHAIIDRHKSILTTDTIAELSRGSSSWASSYSTPAVYPQWRNHDVFLSFIGEYDIKTFVDHLYSTLIQQGIHTYMPDKTPSSGDSIGLSIKNAIEESQIAIIIFTKNYAGSSRCLYELSYIMKCIGMRGLHVMPIFYDVSSSDVQKQSGEFGKEFDKQELENMVKVKSWREALTGACNHSGWSLKHIASRNEGRYIKDIVATISHRLFFFNSNVIKKDLIGIGPRLERLTSELAIGSDDVRMVVVRGIGGSGKSTIASCVYMAISRQFEGRCFVENIREHSSKYGIKKLQQKLLSTILKIEVDVPSDEEGKRMIQSMLCDRKVLIVLDDVNDPHQLESLAGSHDWFGGGSRIILTSREGNVLSSEVDALYDVSILSNDEAIKLFRRHAFPEDNHVGKRKWRPSSSFVEAYDMLSQDVIAYANGVPLTLKILGCFLYEKDKDEWVSTLAKLRDVSDPRITDKLKISYDGLQPDEKELFLDIACFFRGAFVDSLRTLLDAFSFDPLKGVNVLVKRSLISVSNGMFDMHDLVEEMAHNIVREEHPKQPQKHSRVWRCTDIADICAIHATEEFDKIEALYAPNCDSPSNLLKVVANMKNLWLLNVRQHVKEVVEEPVFLSNELRWISWENYPASSFPTSFHPELLSSLILRNGLQKVLWFGHKSLPRLKVLDLHNSKNLIVTPDFRGLPNLERLVLSGCCSLKEINRSIGYLESLVYLNLDSCEKLETFPPIIRMPKLETLILSRCFQLLKFPDIKDTMHGLRHLNMEYSGIEVLPSSVGKYCINLVSINLIGCEKLERIEGNFQRFKQRCVIMVDAHDMRE